MNYFDNIVGQESVKNQLSFHLRAYKENSFLAPTLLVAKRGGGKTEIARSMRNYLTPPESTTPKPFLEINGASLKNPGGLVTKALIPYQNSHATFFIDECHAMDNSVKEFLLSVINVENTRKTRASYDGMELEFDFTLQTFLFATTDPQKLTEAFKSRCKRIDLEPYSQLDMAKIVSKHGERAGIHFHESVEEDIASVCRNTPRQVVKIIGDIRDYCDLYKRRSFSKKDWKSLCSILTIKPHGLNTTEFEILKLLKKNSEMTLTHIANTLSLKKTTVQNDLEIFLMEKGLIKIDGKRTITKAGLEVLKNVDNI